MFKRIRFFKTRSIYVAIMPTIIFYNHRWSKNEQHLIWDLGFVWLKWEIGFGLKY